MQLNKRPKTLLTVLAVIVGVILALRYLLPLLLPFALGYLIALLADPLVRLLRRKTPMPRWLCSGVCITGVFGVLGLLIFFLCRTLWQELVGFVDQLPSLIAELEAPISQIHAWLEQLAAKMPDGIGEAARNWVDNLFAGSSVMAESVYRWLANFVSNLLSGLPGTFLGIFTTILSAFMISSSLPEVKRWLRQRLPEKWRDKAVVLKRRTRSAIGGWLLAQLKLMSITFGLITVGLWLLRVEFPLLFGGIIAVVDALPVLGAGMALIPWGLIAFLQDNTQLGIGLLVLYGFVALTRTTLEPRLVGKQLGLHPLATLIAFYAGFRLMGVLGMVLFPICAILAKQFWELLEIRPAGNYSGRN